MFRRSAIFLLIALYAAPVDAATTCQFVKKGFSLYLQSDCTTDETLLIPNNFNLVGGQHTITAVDPAGGAFAGAVIKNAGPKAKITDVNIVSNLADLCNDEANKVVGILLDKADGYVYRVNISINKGALSVCSEGVGVQVQNSAPVPGAKPPKTTIKNCGFLGNQLSSIRAVGLVNVRLENNIITGAAAAAGAAQRGVELLSGAKGYLLRNTISAHAKGLLADPGIGVLLRNAAAGTGIDNNAIKENDLGILIDGGTGLTVRTNRIVDSLFDGIRLQDASGLSATGCTITQNDVSKNLLNGIYLQSAYGLVFKNNVKSNLITRNREMGILAEGTQNKIQLNTLSLNRVLDIRDAGIGNVYRGNVCAASSGPPVDCPAVVIAP